MAEFSLARLGEKLGQTWPARLAKDAWGAVTLPGDVYQGNVSMYGEGGRTNPEVINRSMDLAGLVTGGSYAAPAMKDASGMGIRAYHGSPHDVERLTPGTNGNYGPAVYHHLDRVDAERYRPEGGKVYENELNIQRPFEMDKPVKAEDASAILRAMGNDKLADDVAKSGRGYFSGSELWYWGLGQGGDKATKAAALRKAGFDAVIGDPGREIAGKSTRSPEVAVFDPALIDIMRKYGLAGLAPLAGYGAMQQGQQPSPQM